MQVKRIVSNIETPNPTDAEAFYESVFGLELVMDHGWIRTYSSGVEMPVQVSIASEGGSGTPVPDLSIEVDDLETALARIRNYMITSNHFHNPLDPRADAYMSAPPGIMIESIIKNRLYHYWNITEHPRNR